MKEMQKYPLTLLFFTFLYAFVLLDIALPDKTRSEIENRELASFPKLTMNALVNNTFTSQLEVYLNDHFPFRDSWITLKSLSESALLKTENNGIAYGADGYMFEKRRDALTAHFERNTERVAQFMSRYPSQNVMLAIVPGAELILSDKLPPGLPLADQRSMINTAYDSAQQAGGRTLDLVGALESMSGEYIYYRTDHHWTTHGAIIGGNAFLGAVGRTPPELSDYTQLEADNFLGTHYNKAKSWNAQPDVITYYDIGFVDILVEGEPKSTYYNPAAFATRDKYAAFLWGNAAITTIRSTANPESRLLVIKDSYANCLAPYLALSYDEVVLIDLRAATFNMSAYLSGEEFDDILILYSFRSFGSDNHIAKLNY